MKNEKTFRNKVVIGFERGKFDGWQVNVVDEHGKKYAPLDKDYFEEMLLMADLFGKDRIYSSFVDVYDRTSREIETEVLDFILALSQEYFDKAIEVEILLTTLYYTMVAEENKAYTKLGKKIKRLGVHQILIDKLPIERAINYSRGMQWREISNECQKRGF